MKHALEVLDFASILSRLERLCESSLAASRASEVEPSWEDAAIWKSLSLTCEAHQLLAMASAPSLASIHDLRQPLLRCSKGGVIGGQELFDIGSALSGMRNFKQFLQSKKADFPGLWPYVEGFCEYPSIERNLNDALESSGDVKDGASETLARLRQRKKAAASRIIERIQAHTTGKSREYLSDPIYTIRDGRYVVPVKSEHRGKIRGLVHDTSGSGHTIYVEPEDVLKLGNELREIEGLEREEVQRILAELSVMVGKIADEMIDAIESAADLDLILSKGRLAYDMKATMPTRAYEPGLEIEGGRHPMIATDTVVPVDISVGFGFDGLLITGPNTGGKTVSMKVAGLCVAMAQAGMFVPARQMKLGTFTQIWADIGDEQSIQQSLSTFSAHIRNIAECLKGLRKGALVLLDEAGAGTDPAEGAALAKSILIEMQAKGARIIASTHYGELKAFAYSTPGFKNAAMEFDAKSLRPTYKLLLGAPGASHALKIAERYGMPREVIDRAKQGLSEEALDVAEMLENLEQSQRQARIAQGEADRRASQLRKAEEIAERKLSEADEIRRTVNAKANAAIEEALREIRLESQKVFDELKSAGGGTAALEQARAALRDIQLRGSEVAAKFSTRDRQRDQKVIEKGMAVKAEGFTQIGTVLTDPANDEVQVQMGPLKLKFKTSQLTPTGSSSNVKASKNIRLEKAQTASREIHLRAMRAEDAERELEGFLDDAVLAGIDQLRIVHGKGEGILRTLTRGILKRHREVKSFRDGEPAEGGQGVTIALLK